MRLGLTAAQRIRADARDATRRALLSAGLSETVANGGVPSIERICARAGYTRGAFYVYFKNREDFAAAMLDWVVSDIFEQLFGGAGDGALGLETIVARFTGAMASHEWPDVPDIRSAYLTVISGLVRSEKVRDRHAVLMRAATAGIESAIERGQEAGTIDPGIDAPSLAQIILLLGIGLIVWDDVGIPLDPLTLGQRLLDLVSPRATS